MAPTNPDGHTLAQRARVHTKLKDWKLNIFKIIDRRIFFYSQNTNMLSRKPKISYRYLKSDVEEFIGSTSSFHVIKLQTTSLLFDGCTTLIL